MREQNQVLFPAKVTAWGEIIPLDDIERMVESLDDHDKINEPIQEGDK